MLRFLFLAFLIVPIIEIGIFIVLGQTIGLWPTLAGIVVTALIGSAVIRSQGISLINEIRQMTSRGQLPARQIADGFMLAISGALLMTPGYFTDLIGFLLLVPAFRLAIFDFLKTRIGAVGGFSMGQSFSSGGFSQDNTNSNSWDRTRGAGDNENRSGQHMNKNMNDSDTVDLDRANWRHEDDEPKKP